jgi:Na+-transporting NADH:ubiquinone oxidoreductase subunit NqrB
MTLPAILATVVRARSQMAVSRSTKGMLLRTVDKSLSLVRAPIATLVDKVFAVRCVWELVSNSNLFAISN